MKEKKHSNEAEGPLAIVLGAAFVGRLIAVPLPGWAGSVKDALGRFLALLVAISHVAVLVQVSFPRRSSEVITKLLKLEEELPRIRRVWQRGSSWRLAWKMPVGVTSEKVLEPKTAIEQALIGVFAPSGPVAGSKIRAVLVAVVGPLRLTGAPPCKSPWRARLGGARPGRQGVRLGPDGYPC